MNQAEVLKLIIIFLIAMYSQEKKVLFKNILDEVVKNKNKIIY